MRRQRRLHLRREMNSKRREEEREDTKGKEELKESDQKKK